MYYLCGIVGIKIKIPEDRVQEIFDQINIFFKYKTHYRKYRREYLIAVTTLAKTYEIYKAKINNPVSMQFEKKCFWLNVFTAKKTTEKRYMQSM